MELYLQFSSMLQEIYGEYTDLVEPYGCDEAWLDVTGSTALKGDEKKIADEIRSRVKKELGITVSIGISWNKIFAKLATVYKGNIIKNLIMDCQSYTKYRPNETTGGIFVSWRRKEELPTGA